MPDAPSWDDPVAPSSSAAPSWDDPFTPSVQPQNKGFVSNLGEAGKAFASNILPGFAEIPEQLTNLGQYAWRHAPEAIAPFLAPTPGSADPYEQINAMNRMFGAPEQPYMDVTSQMRRPIAQLSAQHPYAALAGNIAGSIPAALATGDIGALSKIPQLTKYGPIIKGAVAGGEYGGAQQALQEAGEEIKSNDRLNEWDLLKAELEGALGGALFGGITGGLFGKKIPKEPKLIGYAQRVAQPRALPYVAPKDTSGITSYGGMQPPKEPKLIGYDKNREALEESRKMVYGQILPKEPITPPYKPQLPATIPKKEPIITESPLARSRRELFEEPTTPPTPEEKPTLKGKVEKKEAVPSSWREYRDIAAMPADADLARALKPLAEAKVDLDQAAARLEGALREFDPKLITRPYKTKIIRPEDYKKLADYMETHGVTRGKLAKPTVETTLSEGDQFVPVYKFQTNNPEQEIKDLTQKFLQARLKYAAAKAKAGKQLPLNHTVSVTVKDEAGNVRTVNIKNRQYTAPGGLVYPNAKIKKAVQQLRGSLTQSYSRPFWEKFDNFIHNGLQASQKLSPELKAWFDKLPKDTQAKIIVAFALTAATMYASNEKAEAAPSPKIFGTVIRALVKGGVEATHDPRIVSRITLTQLTTDILRQYGPKFSKLRDGYMEKLTRLLVGSEEQTALGARKRETIEQLDKNYKKALQGEIERVEAAGGKGSRYWRALHFDLQDLGGVNSPLNEGHWMDKITGSIWHSLALGNYRMASMHGGEALVAYAGKHPIATKQAIQGLMTNPVYREYAILNSPKGMFQLFLEKGERFEFQKKLDKLINEPIDNAIKRIVGQKGYDVLSAMGVERLKLGFGSVITAEHNAANYPGGPQQFMTDWMASAKQGTNVPIARRVEFAKVSTQNFVDENKAIMRLPDGKIQERTFYQRHGELVKAAYPALRAINQQTRFFASLLDDAIAAARSGDREKLAQSIGAIILGHFIVAGIAGSHVIPGYVWGVMESIDRPDTDRLREAIDDAQHMLAGGYQVQDFGIKYFPYMRVPNMLAASVYARALKGAASPKDKQQIVRSVIDALAGVVISRIGPEGTMNLDYLLERLQTGMKGIEDYKRYNEYPLMDIALNRPYARKTASGKIDYDIEEGLLHWLLKIENPQEQKIVKKGEQKSQVYLKKDIAKIQHNYQRALAK